MTCYLAPTETESGDPIPVSGRKNLIVQVQVCGSQMARDIRLSFWSSGKSSEDKEPKDVAPREALWGMAQGLSFLPKINS